MKKINKYLFGAFAALLTAGLFSCVETAPEYEPGTPDVAGCNGLYFPTQEASGDHTIDPTMPRKKTIIVKRDSLKGVTNPLPEVEFPLVSSDTTGVFVVPATAKFADGQQETAFDVTFEKAETAVKYPLTIAIEDPKYKSQYSNNVNYIELSVFCVEWKYFMREDNPAEKALFTYVQNWWDETHQFYLKYYEVGDVRYCVTETLPVVDSKGVTWYGTWGTAENEGEYELEFIWYTKTNYVTVPYQNMGCENGSNGYIYAASEDAYYNAYKGDSYNLSWLVKNYPDEVCYYDGMGGFNFFMYYVTPLDSDLAGKAYSWGSVEAAIAEGYVRIDYSIDVEAYETVEGVVPVEFTLGADVAKVKYALAEGELTAKEAGKLVDAIVADSVANNYKSLTPEETTIGVTAEASGIYTLVAVAFDKDGEAQGSAFTSFTYVTAEDAESYAATFSIGFEPVSSMYAHLGYDGTNSIQYFMYGSGLTAAKIGIYETATVEKYGAEVCANALKAVSDEVLEAINGNGYSTMKAGLNPLTSYTVVAWGTNGYNSKVETVEFVTEGVPYYPTVEEVIGTWVYEGTSYWAGSDETDTLVIAASDNA